MISGIRVVLIPKYMQKTVCWRAGSYQDLLYTSRAHTAHRARGARVADRLTVLDNWQVRGVQEHR